MMTVKKLDSKEDQARHVAMLVVEDQLVSMLEGAVNLLEIHRFAFEDEAVNIGCDAGNPDGGSAESCEHCQLIQDIEKIDQILNKASVWYDYYGANYDAFQRKNYNNRPPTSQKV